MSNRDSGARVRIAFAIFAAGWGASQFSPMLIVYRHELALGAGAVAGLFLVYTLTLIPGLLLGGPASDRFRAAPARRPPPGGLSCPPTCPAKATTSSPAWPDTESANMRTSGNAGVW